MIAENYFPHKLAEIYETGDEDIRTEALKYTKQDLSLAISSFTRCKIWNIDLSQILLHRDPDIVSFGDSQADLPGDRVQRIHEQR
jgi:hypothetical protein